MRSSAEQFESILHRAIQLEKHITRFARPGAGIEHQAIEESWRGGGTIAICAETYITSHLTEDFLYLSCEALDAYLPLLLARFVVRPDLFEPLDAWWPISLLAERLSRGNSCLSSDTKSVLRQVLPAVGAISLEGGLSENLRKAVRDLERMVAA